MSKIIIIGAGGHARVLISCLKVLQHNIVGILDPSPEMIGQSIAGIDVIGNDDKIGDYDPTTIELVNGIGSVSSTKKRKYIYDTFKNFGYSFAGVIHPSAIVMDDVRLGEGVQIMAGVIIQPGCVIGDDTIINTGAIVDHDCIIGKHVHVAPGAVLSGGAHVGAMTHIGTSATIIQGIEIGDAVVVGAGAVAISNIPPGVKVSGIPAKTTERRK